jgi:hypothetical protein
VDNTELAKAAGDAMGFDLDWVQGRLFIDCDEAFPGDCVLDTTDSANPVLNVRGAELPINKNLLTKGGRTYELEGIVVNAPLADSGAGKVYIPFQAYRCIAWGFCY